MREQTVNIAMSIIMSAGDARFLCKQSLDAVAKGDLNAAEEFHSQSKKKIAEAHSMQTDVIQSEMNGGDPLEYNSLFTHAQDTLMTVYSEINTTKHLIQICGFFNERLKTVEKCLQDMESNSKATLI